MASLVRVIATSATNQRRKTMTITDLVCRIGLWMVVVGAGTSIAGIVIVFIGIIWERL